MVKRPEWVSLLFLVFLSVVVFSFSPSRINETTGYDIGSEVSDFKLKNIDEQIISLKGYSEGKKGVIVVFTCNHCPFSKKYEDRLIALHKKWEPKGYPVLAINPNDPKIEPEDSFSEMQKRAQSKNFPFAYLVDEEQSVSKKFGANRTPHVFLVEKIGGQFKLRYIGAIDDNANDATQVKEPFLENALMELEKGGLVKKTKTKAIGCTIKWKS